MKDLIKDIPIYGGKLIFVISTNYREDGKKYKLTFTDNDMTCVGLAFDESYKSKRAYYIFIKDTHKDNWGLISHEALHTTNFIMQDVGIPADNNNDEAHCYLLNWIVENIQEHMKKV